MTTQVRQILGYALGFALLAILLSDVVGGSVVVRQNDEHPSVPISESASAGAADASLLRAAGAGPAIATRTRRPRATRSPTRGPWRGFVLGAGARACLDAPGYILNVVARSGQQGLVISSHTPYYLFSNESIGCTINIRSTNPRKIIKLTMLAW